MSAITDGLEAEPSAIVSIVDALSVSMPIEFYTILLFPLLTTLIVPVKE